MTEKDTKDLNQEVVLAAKNVNSDMAAKKTVSAGLEDSMQASEATKNYSTKVHKGYSKAQMKGVYSHCKSRDLYIPRLTLKKMFEWAGMFEAETDVEMEELRQAACKAVSCVFIGNYEIAKKKVNYINSVLEKKLAA